MRAAKAGTGNGFAVGRANQHQPAQVHQRQPFRTLQVAPKVVRPQQKRHVVGVLKVGLGE